MIVVLFFFNWVIHYSPIMWPQNPVSQSVRSHNHDSRQKVHDWPSPGWPEPRAYRFLKEKKAYVTRHLAKFKSRLKNSEIYRMSCNLVRQIFLVMCWLHYFYSHTWSCYPCTCSQILYGTPRSQKWQSGPWMGELITLDSHMYSC